MKEFRTNILSLNFKPSSKNIESIESNYSNSSSIFHQSFTECKEVNLEVKKFVLQKSNIIFIFYIESKNDFVEALAVLKSNYKKVQAGLIKPICILGVHNKKIDQYLLKYGCNIVVDELVSLKAFSLKLELAIKSFGNSDSDTDFKGLGQREESLGKSEGGNTQNPFSSEELRDIENDVDAIANEMNASYYEFDNLVELEKEEFYESNAVNFKNVEYERELKQSKFSLKVEPEDAPNVLEYINENSEVCNLNLQDGRVETDISTSKGKNNFSCKIDNFESDNIVLEVEGICDLEPGDHLSLEIKFLYNKCKVEIELDGTVEDYQTSSNLEESTFLTIKLSQSEEEKLNYFMSLYEQRQKSINDYMKLAKGF